MKKFSKKAHRQPRGGQLAEYRLYKPPQTQFEIHQTHKLRFTNTGTNPATSVTWYNLLDSILVAGTATNGYQLYDFVRVKEVEIWCAGGASSAPAITIGLDFGGITAGNLGGGKSYEDTTVSTAMPAYIRARPDAKSQTAQFQPSGSAYAFHIRSVGAAAGTVVVDVTLEFRNSPVVNPVAVAQAIAAATPGEIYFGGLDGLRSAGTAWRSLMNPNVI